VVIGAGTVGTRKALSLHEAGAFVRVIAPNVSPALVETAQASDRLHVESREYGGAIDLSDAELVFAATDSDDVNAAIARDARKLHRLVNVVSKGTDGSFISMATHRAGRITVGVSAGGVPAAAMEIRDAIAGHFEELFAKDIEEMAEKRGRKIASGPA
jgi:precorrin-2 dehydrogenase / sirohydrochlorin ferrochelatase